jgi:hypothetical protein
MELRWRIIANEPKIMASDRWYGKARQSGRVGAWARGVTWYLGDSIFCLAHGRKTAPYLIDVEYE